MTEQTDTESTLMLTMDSLIDFLKKLQGFTEKQRQDLNYDLSKTEWCRSFYDGQRRGTLEKLAQIRCIPSFHRRVYVQPSVFPTVFPSDCTSITKEKKFFDLKYLQKQLYQPDVTLNPTQQNGINSLTTDKPVKKHMTPKIKQGPTDPVERIIYKAGISATLLSKPVREKNFNRKNIIARTNQPISQELILPVTLEQSDEQMSKILSTDRLISENSHVQCQNENLIENGKILKIHHEQIRISNLTHFKAQETETTSNDRQTIDIDIHKKARQSETPTEQISLSRLGPRGIGLNSQDQIEAPPQFQSLQNHDLVFQSMYYTDRQKFMNERVTSKDGELKIFSPDLGHVIFSQMNQIQSNELQPKTVKTYEFHLPMHHIQEEGTLDAPNQNNHKGIVHKNKRKTGFDKRGKDDISSQMIDDATYQDMQNSVQLLHESEICSKNGSPGRFQKNMVISRRSQKFFQSQTAIIQKENRCNEIHHSNEMKSMQNAASMIQTTGKAFNANQSVERQLTGIIGPSCLKIENGQQAVGNKPRFQRQLVVQTGSGEIKCTPDVTLERERDLISVKKIINEPQFFQNAQASFDLYSQKIKQDKNVKKTYESINGHPNKSIPTINTQFLSFNTSKNQSSTPGRFSRHQSTRQLAQINQRIDTPFRSDKTVTEQSGIYEVMNIASGIQTDGNKNEDFEILRFAIETTRKSNDSFENSCQNPYSQRKIIQIKQHQLDIKIKQKKSREPTPKQTKINKMFKQPSFKKSQQYFTKYNSKSLKRDSDGILLQQGTLKTFKANGELFFRFEEFKQPEKQIGLEALSIPQHTIDEVLRHIDLQNLPDNTIISVPIDAKQINIEKFVTTQQNSVVTTLSHQTPWTNHDPVVTSMLQSSQRQSDPSMPAFNKGSAHKMIIENGDVTTARFLRVEPSDLIISNEHCMNSNKKNELLGKSNLTTTYKQDKNQLVKIDLQTTKSMPKYDTIGKNQKIKLSKTAAFFESLQPVLQWSQNSESDQKDQEFQGVQNQKNTLEGDNRRVINLNKSKQQQLNNGQKTLSLDSNKAIGNQNQSEHTHTSDELNEDHEIKEKITFSVNQKMLLSEEPLNTTSGKNSQTQLQENGEKYSFSKLKTQNISQNESQNGIIQKQHLNEQLNLIEVKEELSMHTHIDTNFSPIIIKSRLAQLAQRSDRGSGTQFKVSNKDLTQDHSFEQEKNLNNFDSQQPRVSVENKNGVILNQSNLSKMENITENLSRIKNPKTVLRDIQKKRGLKIDKAVLSTGQRLNATKSPNKEISNIKLINQDVSQLMEAFFKPNIISDETINNAIFNDVMMFSRERVQLDRRRRKIQSQGNARARRVILGINQEKLNDVKQMSNTGLMNYNVYKKSGMNQWTNLFGDKPLQSSMDLEQKTQNTMHQGDENNWQYKVNKFNLGCPKTEIVNSFQTSNISQLNNNLEQNNVASLNETKNSSSKIEQLRPKVLMLGLDLTNLEEKKRMSSQQNAARRFPVKTNVSSKSYVSMAHLQSSQSNSPKNAQVSQMQPNYFKHQTQINGLGFDNKAFLENLLAQKGPSNPVTYQIPLPAYQRIQGEHGKAMTGLGRALTRINYLNQQADSLGQLGVDPKKMSFNSPTSSEQYTDLNKKVSKVFASLKNIQGQDKNFKRDRVESTVEVETSSIQNLFVSDQQSLGQNSSKNMEIQVQGSQVKPIDRQSIYTQKVDFKTYELNILNEHFLRYDSADLQEYQMMNITSSNDKITNFNGTPQSSQVIKHGLLISTEKKMLTTEINDSGGTQLMRESSQLQPL